MTQCAPSEKSLLPTWIYPSTVVTAQNRLLAAVRGTDQSVQACASLDTATRASWGDFFVQVATFAQQDPGAFGLGSRMDQVQAYELALCQWQERIQAAGCTLTVPKYNPQNPPSDSLAQLAKIVQYASVGAGVVAGAWLVGKLLDFLPRPAVASRAR